MDEYESILLVKQEVFVYRIPPRTTNRGYRAADWNLGSPDWTGRMRLVSKGKGCMMRLEDKVSGETFAKCPIEKYPGVGLEAVTDSSRYFVVKILDDSGRSAFIGLGFGDRSDSFDLNVSLQDHFKWLKAEEAGAGGAEQVALDLGFKEGQTIKINMKIAKKDGQDGPAKPKPKGENGGLLPPPPGGVKLPPPPAATPSPTHTPAPPAASQGEGWGDFSSAPPSGGQTGGAGWVTF